MTREGFRVAAVQTLSGGDVDANLSSIEPLIVEAARQGARLVVLPEYFGIFGARATDKLAVREADGEGPQQAFLARLAKAHGIWLVGGTVPIATRDPARVRSACLVYGPDGQRVARYDKIHLFAFSRGDLVGCPRAEDAEILGQHDQPRALPRSLDDQRLDRAQIGIDVAA